jgi:hypothetical protein
MLKTVETMFGMRGARWKKKSIKLPLQ